MAHVRRLIGVKHNDSFFGGGFSRDKKIAKFYLKNWRSVRMNGYRLLFRAKRMLNIFAMIYSKEQFKITSR